MVVKGGLAWNKLMEQDANEYIIAGLLLATAIYMAARAGLTYFLPKQKN